MALNALPIQLDSLLGALARHRRDWLSGHAEALRVTPIFGSHAELLGAALVTELRGEVTNTAAARVYLNAVVRLQLEGGTAPLSDKLMDALDTNIIRTLDDKWFFWDCEERIGVACNRKHRKVFDQSRRRALAVQESGFVDVLQTAHTLMVDRGFNSYQAMCAELTGIDYGELLDDLDGLLDDSATVYQDHFSELLREAGVFPEDARTHDLIYLFSGHYGVARRLPETGDMLRETCAAMGLPLDAAPGLSVDVAETEGKHPGVHVADVSAPAAPHLLLRPGGGWQGSLDALVGAGQALFRAWIPADLPFASRALIDPALDTAYGMLFASLLGNPVWLARFAPRAEVKAWQRLFHFWWLHQLRWLTGSLQFSRFLHGPGEVMDKADTLEHTMHRAVAARIERDYYLYLTPDFFDQAQVLRGHFLASQLLTQVTDRLGDGWFEHPELADYLKGLWACGGADLDALATHAGLAEPFDIWPLTERLEAVLGRFEAG